MHPKKKEKSQEEHETDDVYQVPMHFAHAPYLCAPTSPSMVSGVMATNRSTCLAGHPQVCYATVRFWT